MIQVAMILANQSIRKSTQASVSSRAKTNRSPRHAPLPTADEVSSLYQSSRTPLTSLIQNIGLNQLRYQGQQAQPQPQPQSQPQAQNQTSPLTESVRVVQTRPKPQCWEHGCNGRQFSTFSNLLRHQREKSGSASKSRCPKCGAEFTRTTAWNGHMAHEKCKPRHSE